MSKEMTAAPAVKQRVQIDPKYVTRLTGILLAICVVVSLLLGIVNKVTEPVISQMQAEKTQAAMQQVLPATDYNPLETEVENVTAMYEANSGGNTKGYVMEVTSSGFGGAISMVVGVDFAGNVTGVSIINAAETPNIGSKVVEDQAVLDRFIGMSHTAGTITVNAGENRFDGVTGATVSSRGVTAGVNTALAAAAAYIG